MAKWFRVTAVAIAGVLLLGMAGIAFAADPTPTPGPGGWGNGCPGHGGWGYGGWGMGPGYGVVADAVTNLLGMTLEEIRTERLAGKSLAQIAQEKGISEEKLIDTIIAAKKAILDQLVADGHITQAQADASLERMAERAREAVERTTVGPFQGSGFGWYGNGMTGGGMMGGWGRWDTPGADGQTGSPRFGMMGRGWQR
jgi:hypothetical protein